ncbi:MAG: HEAT repeat domain-containing protein, partial [Planctomycetes bacterium]|nr:HEAT repeat domain-containing protein [Planctomycetota bacterium]
ARKMLGSDRDAGVRNMAAVSLGMLKDKDSVPLLRERLADSSPTVRYYSAWALARMHDPAGFRHIERLALSNDPTIAPQAIMALGGLGTSESVPTLYRCLFSRKEKVWGAAVEAISALPEKTVEAGLENLPKEQKSSVTVRFAMLACIIGRGKVPAECANIIRNGNREERILAVRCYEKGVGGDSVPALIYATYDDEAEVCLAATEALGRVIKEKKLAQKKDGSWEEWWFGQHYVLSAGSAEALLLDPLGNKEKVKLGVKASLGAVVVSIKPGTGKDKREEARVVLQSGRMRFEIRPYR